MNFRAISLPFIVVFGILVTNGLAQPVVLAIAQDRIYRAGVFLVVDALVENKSPRDVEAAEVSVEFYTFFHELVRVEHSFLAPTTLGPGQVAALRVVTPYSDTVRRIHYRFTWRRDREQFQAVSKRDVWAIGSATRETGPGRWP